MSPSKGRIRKAVLQKRDALSPEDRAASSRAIGENLTGLSVWPGKGVVLFFHSFRSEVETRPMIENALRAGLPVGLPRMAPEGKLQLFMIKDLAEDLEVNAIDIPEPRIDLPSANPTELGIVIVPGAAFDPEGYRIGYGGGYYDRLLVCAPQAHRIAVAFELQRVPALPRGPHDVPVDILVTETGSTIFHRRFQTDSPNV